MAIYPNQALAVLSYILLNTLTFVLVISVPLPVTYSDTPIKTQPKPQQQSQSPFAGYSSPAYNTLTFDVQKGDTLLIMLRNLNIGNQDIAKSINALKKVYSPSSLYVGQEITITFSISDDPPYPIVLQSIALEVDYSHSIEVVRKEGGDFRTRKKLHPIQTKLIGVSGKIEQSLFQTANEMGIDEKVLLEIIQAFSYDIDFQRDIHAGDSMTLLLNRVFDEHGKAVHDKHIVYVELTLKNKPYRIYRFHDEYYDENGRNVRKSLLRTPINGARISSNYGRRRHPILGYTKLHKGVDFAAPRGTPILAAGDGVVTYRGRKGAYGNYLRIKHNNVYSTAYAHISRFNRKVRKGSKVKQGQVIAYVGSTGRSTGPHLHYEVLLHGTAINPKRLKATPGSLLTKDKMRLFLAQKKQLDKLIATIPSPTKVATQ